MDPSFTKRGWGDFKTFIQDTGMSKGESFDEASPLFIEECMSGKDIHTLIKLARKCGESICDKGTFEERQSKHLVMKWKYKGKAFAHKFPGSTKTSTLNHQYSQMRKNLRASGLEPPSGFSTEFMGSDEQQKLLEELWAHLGTDDEGETPYGGDVEIEDK